MVIEYYIKNIYGNVTIYIADREIATTIQTLTGKKTVNSLDLNALEKLGHTVKRAHETINIGL